MKTNIHTSLVAVSALLLSLSAQAHDPKEHMTNGEQPDCAAIMQMDQSQMHMNQDQMHMNQDQMHKGQSQMQMNQDQMHKDQSQMQMNQDQMHKDQSQMHMNQDQMHKDQSQMHMHQGQMDMNDPVMQALREKCMKEQPQDKDDHHMMDQHGKGHSQG
ncbi:hypothetical protein SHLO109777_08140 [Shewanella loihica]|uniref:Pentapeptide MXKDX repeat protein n=1 Tax=Shewanella loihica (strain ATCC BAA-1088 / PV-4) TaxID=323850 RepID=A3QI23_SHELP|nr:hypothetical protein [Shewanella loihica]ABO25121.1 hypothetical protein Shew_3255 [Shewanella loihica PV-4]